MRKNKNVNKCKQYVKSLFYIYNHFNEIDEFRCGEPLTKDSFNFIEDLIMDLDGTIFLSCDLTEEEADELEQGYQEFVKNYSKYKGYPPFALVEVSEYYPSINTEENLSNIFSDDLPF